MVLEFCPDQNHLEIVQRWKWTVINLIAHVSLLHSPELGVEGRIRTGKKSEDMMTNLILGQCPVLPWVYQSPRYRKLQRAGRNFYLKETIAWIPPNVLLGCYICRGQAE